ncbi:MAG: metallophosphoesterase [Blastocatellia bacterium]
MTIASIYRLFREPFASACLCAVLWLLTATHGAAAPLVTRGPYLQKATPSAITVRWRTDTPTTSRVLYGAAPGALAAFADDPDVTTEHSVRLRGLTAGTVYYYAVGSTTQTLAGGHAGYFFQTPPAPGTAVPTRIWVLGDAGTASAGQQAVRDAYLNFTGAKQTSLWLMLGDNAYQNGTDSEYQAAVFDLYPMTLRQSALWPALGNHDTAQLSNPAPAIPYFDIFDLPVNGDAGGLASGTESYYSFDYGNIHFVCLDSMTSSRAPDGPMLTWLQSDLANNTRQWLIAFWHHPPYTKGSHDSDAETQLTEMRANALPLLESYGVDLVLTGHSHAYERSFLLDGHYGLSETLTLAMKKNGGDGRPAGNGAYVKPTGGPGPREGAVYVVAGSSGQTGGGALNHPAMFLSLNNLGSLVLDVNNNQLDAKFIRENGVIADSFTMQKNPAGNGCQAITLSPVQPTGGFQGQNYSQTFTASGPTGPFSFSVTGGVKPPGLTLAQDGTLSGMPTAPGVYSFTVTATNGVCAGSRALTMVISGQGLMYSRCRGRCVCWIRARGRRPAMRPARPFLAPRPARKPPPGEAATA